MNSMNSKTTIIGLVAAIAVLSGAMGLSVTGAFSDLKTAGSEPAFVTTGMLIGHLEIEAHNADGELFAYRQVDNAVVDTGEQCILKMLFADDSGDYASAGRGEFASNAICTGALTGAWDVIAIGTSDTAPVDIDIKLASEVTANGGQRAFASSKTWQNGSSKTGEASTPIAKTQIVMSNTFTAVGGNIGIINESGLFNSTTADATGMLARNTFDDVTINTGDSITITWTFTVGD